MSFEPQKFFIGLVDFFSVLLPGVLFTYLLRDEIASHVLNHPHWELATTEDALVFLFASYLLGHFVFLLGSWLLDGYCYDPLRKATYGEQVKNLAEGGKLSNAWLRRLSQFLFNPETDVTLRKAARIKEHYLEPLGASATVNAFQWAKARLTSECPEALATVQRFEADAKFFRSLVIVLLALLPWSLWYHKTAVSIAIGPLLVLALWRYIDQRRKSTSQAYWYVIAREAVSPSGYRVPPPDATLPTHAGGVVFRRKSDTIEYLLVGAKRERDEWVLPKGPIEDDERPADAAVREVREETGVWAAVRKDLTTEMYPIDGAYIRVKFYLMEIAVLERPSDIDRKSRWLSLPEAIALTKYAETEGLLRMAQLQAAKALE